MLHAAPLTPEENERGAVCGIRTAPTHTTLLGDKQTEKGDGMWESRHPCSVVNPRRKSNP